MVCVTVSLIPRVLTMTDITDEAQRMKVLHLVGCLLPKAHRDTMEVLFCFLNWVSSFHTVDEETGNKMDTWNIATVMAPNILRENNEKEMKSVDQGAVRVVFDLIENNDEFCEVSIHLCCNVCPNHADLVQVPPEIVDLLYDDSSSELTPKEIMRQWEQRGRNPAGAPGASPRTQTAGASARKDQRNAPHITQADHNPQALSGESSVRHIAGAGGPGQPASNNHSTPPQQYDLGTPNLPYSQTAPGSAESPRNGSPHRHSYRSPALQKQTLGTAGAG